MVDEARQEPRDASPMDASTPESIFAHLDEATCNALTELGATGSAPIHRVSPHRWSSILACDLVYSCRVERLSALAAVTVRVSQEFWGEAAS